MVLLLSPARLARNSGRWICGSAALSLCPLLRLGTNPAIQCLSLPMHRPFKAFLDQAHTAFPASAVRTVRDVPVKAVKANRPAVRAAILWAIRLTHIFCLKCPGVEEML